MSAVPADRCRLPQAFWRAAGRAGISASAVLRQAKLPATLHARPDMWLTTAQYFALWRAVEALTPDPAIGLRMTTETDTAGHPPATMSAFFARDYRDGLQRLARFKCLCTPEQLTLSESGHECRIAVRWPYAHGTEPASVIDVIFATIIELGRRGTGRHITPRHVEMTRPDPASDAHRDYFGAPVRTACAANAIVLRRSDLDWPFAAHNSELLAILDPSLVGMLAEIEAQSSLSDHVKILIKRRIASGKPDIAEIARDLGLSERTLQRRIAEQGDSFRGLLDQARRELGQSLLAQGQSGIDEIAFLLGFQDTSSFYRAFRTWEGITPARWKRLH